MPMRSIAQNRFMHWADEHPQEAAKRGLKPSVVHDFISAQHGHSLKGLPQRVERKCDGGAVGGGAYPRKFSW